MQSSDIRIFCLAMVICVELSTSPHSTNSITATTDNTSQDIGEKTLLSFSSYYASEKSIYSEQPTADVGEHIFESDVALHDELPETSSIIERDGNCSTYHISDKAQTTIMSPFELLRSMKQSHTEKKRFEDQTPVVGASEGVIDANKKGNTTPAIKSDTTKVWLHTTGESRIQPVIVVLGNINFNVTDYNQLCQHKCNGRNIHSSSSKYSIYSSFHQIKTNSNENVFMLKSKVSTQVRIKMISNTNNIYSSDCSCDEICVITGDCCVDVFESCFALNEAGDILTFISDIKAKVFGDISLSELAEDWAIHSGITNTIIYNYALQFASLVQTQGEQILLIWRCPLNINENSIKEKCEDPSTPLLPPVTINLPVGTLAFLNIFCAQCHGFNNTNATPWETAVECQTPSTDNYQTKMFSELTRLVKTGDCVITFTSTNYSGVGRNINSLKFLTEMQQKKLVNNFSKEECTVEDKLLCQSYFFPVTVGYRMYKNPHCQKCLESENARDESHPPNVLYRLAQPDTGSIDIGSSIEKGGSNPLGGILIILDPTGRYSQGGQGFYACEDTEVFDPFTLVCKEHICPPWSVSYRGQCYKSKNVYLMPPSSQLFPNGWEKMDVQWNTSSTHDSFRCNNLATVFHNLSLQLETLQCIEIPYLKMDQSNLTDYDIVTAKSNITEDSFQLSINISKININFADYLKQIASSLINIDNSMSKIMITNIGSLKHFRNCSNGGIPKGKRGFNLTTTKEVVYAVLNTSQVGIFYPLINIGYELVFHRPPDPSRPWPFQETIFVCDINTLFYRSNCSIVSYNINDTLQNGSRLLIVSSGRYFEEGDFEIQGNQVFICFQTQNDDQKQSLLYLVLSFLLTIISIVCLMLVLITYCIFPELRSLPGKMTASLAGTMMLTFLSNLFSLVELHHDYVCPIMAVLSHVVTLAHFGWMSAIAINMALTFGPGANYLAKSVKANSLFRRYNIVVWGSSVTIVILSAALAFIHRKTNSLSDTHSKPHDFGNETDSDVLTLVSFYGSALPSISPSTYVSEYPLYGFPFCTWFSGPLWTRLAFIIVPYLVTFIINIIGFAVTLVGLQRSSRESEKVRKRSSEKTRCLIYIKLSTAMGFSWIFSVVTFPKSDVLPYIYLCLVLLQGVLLFAAFVVNKRVCDLIRNTLLCRKGTVSKNVTKSSDLTTVRSRSV